MLITCYSVNPKLKQTELIRYMRKTVRDESGVAGRVRGGLVCMVAVYVEVLGGGSEEQNAIKIKTLIWEMF